VCAWDTGVVRITHLLHGSAVACSDGAGGGGMRDGDVT